MVDGDGNSVPLGGGGYLVLKRPWPGMLRGIYGDPERYKQTYWSRFPGMYFAGDGAKRDEDGYFWLLGPGRRRDERLRPPHLDDRGRVGAGRPPGGRRGGGRRQARPDHRRGDLRLRDPQARRRADRGARRGAAQARRQGHRPDRQAEVPDVHAGPAEDPLRQDHAPAPARHRRGPPLGDTTTLADAGVVETIREHSWTAEDYRVPFDFLKRKKDARATAKATPPRRQPAGPRRRVRRADRGVAARRPDAGHGPAVRRAQQARGDPDRRTSSGRRSTGRPSSLEAPGLKAVDPYDLIIVLAGEARCRR